MEVEWFLYHFKFTRAKSSLGITLLLISLATPGPPYALTVVTVSKRHVDLKWEPPKSDGGRPITKYIAILYYTYIWNIPFIRNTYMPAVIQSANYVAAKIMQVQVKALLNFTPNIRMEKMCDLCDFNHSKAVGASWTGCKYFINCWSLEIFTPNDQYSLELCGKTNRIVWGEKTLSKQQSCGKKCLVDKRSEKMARLVWASRKDEVTHIITHLQPLWVEKHLSKHKT